MKTSQKGIDLIKEFEGFRPSAYRCPSGILTLGYGHTQNVRCSDVVTPYEAEILLKKDLAEAERAVNTLVKTHISQNQFDALVSFVFNVGIGNFLTSTLLKRVNENPNDKIIRDAFMMWVKSRGVILKGLVRRRTCEADLYFTKSE